MKFVLDADGIIKLAKAGVLVMLTTIARCMLSVPVYEEVLKGKEKLYEDAFIIEELVKTGKIKLIPIRIIEQRLDFGRGETSALAGFKKYGADAIISDDRKFLTLLDEQGVPFLRPSDVIVLLLKRKRLLREDANSALVKLKPFIREEDYYEVKNQIGGK